MAALIMMTAADSRDEEPQSERETALLKAVDGYRADVAVLLARVAELEQQTLHDPDLRPLRSLCRDDAEYSSALRARDASKLTVVKVGGNLFSKAESVAAWRAMTGRKPL